MANLTPREQAPRLVVRDRVWASELQHSLDDFLYEVYDALDGDLEGGGGGTVGIEGEDRPFCGCSSCEGRTTINFLAPRIIKGFLEERLDIVELDGGA
jgi:hypothetical protein